MEEGEQGAIDIQKMLRESEATARKYNRLLAGLFVTALLGFALIVQRFPELSEWAASQ